MRSVIIVTEAGVASDAIFSKLAESGLLTATFQNPAEVARLAARIEAVFGFVSRGREETQALLEAVASSRDLGRPTTVLILSPSAQEVPEVPVDVHVLPFPVRPELVVQWVHRARIEQPDA